MLFRKRRKVEEMDWARYEKEVFSRTIEQEFIARRVLVRRGTPMSSPENFLFFKYDSHLPIFNGFVNYGDYIQTIATKLAVESVIDSGFKFDFVDRDSLFYYVPKEDEFAISICLMQGWFSHTLNFFPNKNICPIWIGVHFNRVVHKYIEQALAVDPLFFREEVGCRDLSTLDFLRNLGVRAYFSRCLTLTLPKRKTQGQQDKIYFVDIPDEVMKLFPLKIKENAEVRRQRWCHVGNEYWKKTYDHAQEILDDLQQAHLVITSALHCAAPCVAMGIPVILISLDPLENANRFSALNGILNSITVNEIIDRRVSYDVVAPDIEELKMAMLKNVSLVIQRTGRGGVSNSELKDVRDYISNYSVVG